MADIIKLNSSPVEESENSIIERNEDLALLSEGSLSDLHSDITHRTYMSMPITQLATLGAGVSSLLPSLRTVTQTTTVNVDGLYRLANASVGDTLKIAKNGNFWGAFKTAEGGSKFAQLQQAGPLTANSTSVAAINPATMMMAVALFSIEQQLGNIAEMEKQILSFLEIEKESKIEADVRTLSHIIANYKHNWDNELFVASNHKLVLDIQRSARAHMLSYQAHVGEAVKSRQLVIAQKKVSSTLNDLIKKFKYYRLSLFTYSMASLIEIMLSGNFNENYIAGICDELRKLSYDYRDLFTKCSVHLEKLSGSAIEKNVMKGLGNTGEALGRFIGNIPVVKNGPVDELLQDSGAKLKKSTENLEAEAVRSFADMSNPGTQVFISRMEDMVQIYNHTSEIAFDDKKIYLIA